MAKTVDYDDIVHKEKGYIRVISEALNDLQQDGKSIDMNVSIDHVVNSQNGLKALNPTGRFKYEETSGTLLH